MTSLTFNLNKESYKIANNLLIGNDVLIWEDEWSVTTSSANFTCIINNNNNRIYPIHKFSSLHMCNLNRTKAHLIQHIKEILSNY